MDLEVDGSGSETSKVRNAGSERRQCHCGGITGALKRLVESVRSSIGT